MSDEIRIRLLRIDVKRRRDRFEGLYQKKIVRVNVTTRSYTVINVRVNIDIHNSTCNIVLHMNEYKWMNAKVEVNRGSYDLIM